MKNSKNEQKSQKNLFYANFGYFSKSKLEMDVIFGISVVELCSWYGSSVNKHRNNRKKAICNYKSEKMKISVLPVSNLCVPSGCLFRVFSFVLFTPCGV